MTDLAEFLLARIAEDEAVALAAREDLKYGPPPVESFFGERAHVDHRVIHINRHNPARVLAECKAKRRLVALHNPCDDWSYGDASTCPDLQALSLPFADHPDYQQEWKP